MGAVGGGGGQLWVKTVAGVVAGTGVWYCGRCLVCLLFLLSGAGALRYQAVYFRPRSRVHRGGRSHPDLEVRLHLFIIGFIPPWGEVVFGRRRGQGPTQDVHFDIILWYKFIKYLTRQLVTLFSTIHHETCQYTLACINVRLIQCITKTH